MNNLLVIERKFCKNTIYNLCKKKNCEVIIIQNNLLEILNEKQRKINKLILITENILARNSDIYKWIKSYIRNKKIFFVEIGYKKSKIPQDKAISDALINGAGINTQSILEKIIDSKND
tara:strand:- start:682 stop:1038 length:357 start_codon:yes stop_codon:yes gene_type:complete